MYFGHIPILVDKLVLCFEQKFVGATTLYMAMYDVLCLCYMYQQVDSVFVFVFFFTGKLLL